MRILIYISLFFFTAFKIEAQESKLSQYEDDLVVLLDQLRSAKTNSEKKEINLQFKNKFNEVLQSKDALTYPFSRLKTVGVIDSPDKQMRIINWNVEQEDFSHTYTCFVLHFDKRRKSYHVTELKDVSFGMPSHPTEIISANNWYGALYYKIIPVKKGSKTLYTVLGWDHNSTMSQVKLIDVIYFTGKTVKIGSPIFKEGKTTKKRIFFEHSKKTTMSLKYEDDRERIIFDHLSPESPSMKKFRSYYVPDMSYDAFILEGSKWILQEDVIGVNKSSGNKTETVLVQNPKTGKIEEKEIKNKWLDPSSEDSKHVAITPEMLDENKELKKKSEEPKIDKKDKRDPSQVSFYNDVNNKKKRRRKKRRNR